MATETLYYKCLTTDRKSWYDGETQWELGTWMPEIENGHGTEPCGKGYHLGTSIDATIKYGKFPCRIYEAEGKGEYGRDEDKVRFRTARIVKDVTPDYFISENDFIESIKEIKWFSNCSPERKEWMFFDTRAAAWDAARAAAARDAAWDAAGAAAWDAARAAAARDAAARDVAWGAAWDAARAAAAWDAARAAAARDAAARDAALYALILICGGLNASALNPTHVAHAKARWNVWQRGYGLLCDVDGVLFVYRKP